MTHMITRCPACETCFRITEAQLNTAKGAVRCGSCLQIFRALDNRVDDSAAPFSSPGPSPSGATTPEAAAGPQSPWTPTPVTEIVGNSLTASSPSTSTPSPAHGPQADDDNMLISDEMLLEDDEEEQSSFYDDDLNTNFLKTGWNPSHSSLFEREPKAPKEDNEDKEELDESWAINLLEDDEPGEATDWVHAGPHAPPAPVTRELEETAERDVGVEPEAQQEAELGSALDDFDELFDGEGENLVRERRHLLSSIQPEPVEFSSYHRRNWRGVLLWGGLSLLGIVVLIGQIGWLQFDSLSRHQPYRSIYTTLCPLLKCEVPALAAPELIRTSNLVVRSHPQTEGALVVDTILLNTASFRQPFPPLTLTFSNRHGETIASRRFQPAEYLAGELAGYQLMPSNQPIHLTLEILDPGPDAVSYSAYIPR